MVKELLISDKDNFVYDERVDSLYISRKKSGEEVAGSVEIANISIDITSEGRIVGIEINEISEFLKDLNVDTNILKGIESAGFSVLPKRNGVLYFLIEMKNPEIYRKIPLPVITPENFNRQSNA